MLKEILGSIKDEINEYKENYSEFLDQKKEALIKLSYIASELHDSWSKSWFEMYSSFYFYNFEKPSWQYQFDQSVAHLIGIPDNWIEKNYDDIANYIENKADGLSLRLIQNEIEPLAVRIKEIQYLLVTNLVVIQDNEYFRKEWVLVEKLENYVWSSTIDDLNYKKTPIRFHVSSTVVQQEVKVPPHILYENQVTVELSKIQSIEEFLKTSERIIKQIELKIDYYRLKSQEDHIYLIMNILSKFPIISRQLRNRHENRSTIEIEDEYDVQDLLHALLKLHFDDIRAEEWTPSYAGCSSRMDFLLKNEKVVIEVKKTRKGLDEKHVGEQLIIDIVKYESHPDCESLICFIYDPEGRIGNPKGLENDLNQMLTEKMKVITIIEPKFR